MKRIALVGFIAATILAPYAGAAQFNDVYIWDPYANAINTVADLGYVQGYADGTFRAGQTINRAELLKILMEYMKFDASTTRSCFKDVKDEWFAPYVCGALERGIIQGYSDGTFRPGNTISFAEAAAMVVRIRRDPVIQSNVWYEPFIERLKEMDAYPFSIEKPDQALERGEMAYIVYAIHKHDSMNHNEVMKYRTDQPYISMFFEYPNEELDRLMAFELPQEELDVEELYAWDEIAMGIVRRRTTVFYPSVAPRLYAALAIAQRDVVAIGTVLGASSKDALDLVSMKVICRMSPEDCHLVQVDTNYNRYAEEVSSLVMRKLEEIIKNDNRNTSQLQPVGKQFWVGKNPQAPFAAEWDPWIADLEAIRTPPPPAYGSPQDLSEIQNVYNTLQNLSAKQIAAAHYWATADGTESAAGAFVVLTDRLLREQNANLLRAADVRSTVYTAMSDAFIAAWRGKYTYWTARPSMRDPNIVPIIADPNFPSYPSGHATVAGVSFEMLRYFFPEKEAWLKQITEEDRDSRIWGGVHFDIDNTVGYTLGQETGLDVTEWHKYHSKVVQHDKKVVSLLH